MPERAPRYPCPACLGVTMEKTPVGKGGAVEVDHCRRCGGVWLEYGEVQALRALPAAALWAAVSRRGTDFLMPCHDCHTPFSRDAAACPACGWKNVLECPACAAPMHRESAGGIHLDVCRGCRGVWVDHHELEALWKMRAGAALARRPAAHRAADAADDAADVLMAALWFSPDLVFVGAHAAGHAASAAVDAAAHLPGLAAAAPEAAAGLVEAAGEAAGGVFEAIAAILEGLFGMFDA